MGEKWKGDSDMKGVKESRKGVRNNSGVPKGGLRGSNPPPPKKKKFRRPSKIVPNSTRL